MSRSFAVVVAADEQRGIGRAGGLPWRLAGDMAYFKRLTRSAPPGQQNAVIMGRRTFDSIPARFRPLPGRHNIVLSRAPDHRPEGAVAARSLEQALALSEALPGLAACFVIGGGVLYADALVHPACARVYLTRIHARFDCDVFLPAFEARFRRVAAEGPHQEEGLSYTFETYDAGGTS